MIEGAAELADRRVEREPGARGVLLEHHRQRAVSGRRVGVDLAFRPAEPRGLAGLGVVEDLPQVGRLEAPEVEEVPPGRLMRPRPLASGRLAGALQLLDRLAGLLAGDQQRGEQPHAVVAAAGDQQMLVAGQAHELAVVGEQLKSDQQALAADLLDHVRMAVLQPRELLGEVAGDVAHVGERRFAGQLLERRQAHRHGERVAAVGRAVRAHGHALGRLGGGQARADREAVAERLGDAHDVRQGVLGPLVSEELAGAPEPALDLVEDQQHALRRAELAHAGEVGFGQRARAALALHRLDQHGAGLIGDRRFQRLHVAVGQRRVARQRRAEALGVGRDCRPHRPPRRCGRGRRPRSR